MWCRVGGSQANGDKSYLPCFIQDLCLGSPGLGSQGLGSQGLGSQGATNTIRNISLIVLVVPAVSASREVYRRGPQERSTREDHK